MVAPVIAGVHVFRGRLFADSCALLSSRCYNPTSRLVLFDSLAPNKRWGFLYHSFTDLSSDQSLFVSLPTIDSEFADEPAAKVRGPFRDLAGLHCFVVQRASNQSTDVHLPNSTAADSIVLPSPTTGISEQFSTNDCQNTHEVSKL